MPVQLSFIWMAGRRPLSRQPALLRWRAGIIVGEELLRLDARTEQGDAAPIIVEREDADNLALIVIDRAAGEAVLPIDFCGIILRAAEGIRAVEAAPADQLLAARLGDQQQRLVLA